MEQRHNNGPMSLGQLVSSDGNLSQRPVEQPQAHNRPALSFQERKVVSGVFEQLQSIFPAWRQSFPTEDSLNSAKRELTKALIESGTTSLDQIAVGMRVARSKKIPFFPAPGQFIDWCEVTPESMGLPTIEQAFYEVGTRRYSHPAVELAARATKFDGQNMTAKEYQPIFARAYQMLIRRVVAGEDLHAEIMKALPTKEQVQHSPEYYQQAGQRGVAMLKSKFGRQS